MTTGDHKALVLVLFLEATEFTWTIMKVKDIPLSDGRSPARPVSDWVSIKQD